MKRPMTMYIISPLSIMCGAVIIAALTSVATFLAHTYFSSLDLPEVHVTPAGKCLRVINFRNGDGFSCQDKDVVLRKYHTKQDAQPHEQPTP